MLRDEATLLDIDRYARAILSFTENLDRKSFDNDPKTQAAVLYNLSIIGEAVKRLSPSFCEQHPTIPWSDIAKMRDKVIHHYDRIKLDIIWNTIYQDIPSLIAAISPLLPDDPSI
ncbi:MAG: DUF86 domain-containing protein [Cyanophyceae cyanobacterium]